MKKSIAVIATIFLCIGLAACAEGRTTVSVQGGGSAQPSESSPPPVSDNGVSSETTSSDPSQETSTETSSQPSSSIQSTPTVNVTIPEGYALWQIGGVLEAKKVCKREDFLAAINSFDCSGYKLAGKIPYDPKRRCYKLEGYLFPDTYNFYLNSKPKDVIARMLRNAENKIGNKYSYPGMTTDEIITLASIIQKEVDKYSDMQKASCVFHNRLKKNMMLQADSTVYYLTIPYIPENLVDTYKYYYNTVRRCKGLPAGPICSPGALALKAAANPADANYLYFVSDKNGNYYFSATYEEHLQICEKYGITPES